MGIKSHIHLDLLNLVVTVIFVAILFEGFMQWKYPIQKNEYKKTVCFFLILLLIVPVAYLFIPADLLVK